MIRLALAGLRHHRALWAGVVLAAALCAALVGGGLLVGDALRAALVARTAARLGPVTVVVEGPEGGLSAELGPALAAALGAPVAPTLHRTAVARGPDGAARAVDLWAVDAGMAALAGHPDAAPVPGGARMRADLMVRLGVEEGDRLAVRVARPSALSRDLALTRAEGALAGLSVEVGAALPDVWPARLGLDARPGEPDVVLVDRAWLVERLDLPDRPNRLLVAGVDALAVRAALDEAVRLEDGDLTLRTVGDELLLASPRVVLPPAVAEAAATLPGAVPALVWLVEGFAADGAEAAYGFVGAVPHDRAGTLALGRQVPLPEGPGIVPTAWLAHDLGVAPGARLRLRYPVFQTGRGVGQGEAELEVLGIAPDAAADPSWMPPIEGIEGRASCREWDPGLPIRLDAITDRDEAWWAAHGGAPKAWVDADTARTLFGSALGDTTSVRWPAGTDATAVRAELTRALGPAGLGVRVTPVARRLGATEAPSNDFGTLFLGFQTVLIASALGLAALQSGLAWEHRAPEIGALRALGWSRGRVLRLVGLEVGLAAALGALLGAPLALGVARALLWGLAGPWQGALPGASLRPVVSAGPVAVGVVASALLVGGAGLVAARRALAASPRALLAGTTALAPRRPALPLVLAALACVAASVAVAVATPDARTPEVALAFFGAGGLALGAGLLGVAAWLRAGGGSPLGPRGASRRPGRAAAVVGLVALGAFLVAGVGLGGGRAVPDPTDRTSGTGGFGWLVEAALPVPHRLDRAWGLRDLGVEGVAPDGLVALRVLDGDDASCLQLGSAQAPTLLGVDPAALAARGAFGVVDGPEGVEPWSLLAADLGPGRLPAIADASTVTWGLHAQRGDAVTWLDREGEAVEVVIVAVITSSIVQGALLVDRERLDATFPATGGDRLWLVDGHGADGEAVARALVGALEPWGASALPTAERLATFAAVEEAYVGVFRALGGLGLALGAAGLALLLARVVVERRAELAMLRAVGFSRGRLARLLLVEHLALVAAGLGVGGLAGLIAVVPVLRSPDAAPPWAEVAAALAGTGLVGFLALAAAAWRTTADVPLRELSRDRR